MRNTIPTPEELNKGKIKFGTLFIRPLRISAVCPFIRYQVGDGEYCYGKFNSKEQAIDFCRQLYEERLDEPIKESATQI
ncbi:MULTISPECIES: hypothetical protein [Xenorhabdus]|uniref:hypothetical protein n=1 Tax=Xenorhabdus TaxID=626 RepID=UPI0006AA0A49|nr:MULTISPECIES: hypothetical protein [Xenorhabdus]WFQ78854.1 hypothetical protein PXH59_14515 [Xenorhabdus sp. SF857]WFQ80023.1 hypothetical protein PXH59_02200 [Xenorhabdus sp. SF857]WFQ80901.1 hypothetical protein PXH59_07325 [Xenorhabdus sp. SF857]